jgi:hypothetical protein
MIKKAYILLGILLLTANIMFAQSPSTVKAYELYTQGEYALASKTIDQAVQEKEGMSDPLTWQLRAIIYYDLFAKTESKNSLSESRVKSLQSALKSMEIDEDKKYYDQNILILDKISISYYNDAVIAINNIDPQNPDFAENSFQEYLRIQRIAHPDESLKSKEIDFYRAQATSFGKRYQTDPVANAEYFNLTIASLQKVLLIDSMDYGANYNLAIYYYNEGVYKIETINSVIPIDVIIIIEKEGIDLFKKALPYMLRAHEIKQREETFKGLRGIYRSLNDMAKYEQYNDELEKFLENKSD